MLSLVISLSAGLAAADCYLHNPRGSNNRLAEEDANRNNGDRLFDSQNNNRGGYNVGAKTHRDFDTNNPFAAPSTTFDETDLEGRIQYQFAFYEGSEITWEWTSQHGCGGNEATDPHKLNCNIMLQYVCDTEPYAEGVFDDGHMDIDLRDGGNTGTPSEATSFASLDSTRDNNRNNNRGLHESEAYYLMCERRRRNYRLFHADQNVNTPSTRGTRQNPNGNRRGLECPEERDYYPYWNPSPWRDVAYLTDDVEGSCDRVMEGSQNHNPVSYCDGLLENDNLDGYIPVEMETCEEMGGVWKSFNKNIDPPACDQVGWSRVNHLGNGRHGQPLHYNWTLPSYQSLLDSGNKETEAGFIKCVARIRYNMTTDDYDPQNTFSDQDDRPNLGIVSPVQQDPAEDIGTETLTGLYLAINTNQFGRTFQDRSHVFYVTKRPANFATQKIYNLNVRGKRCNIVQCFPGVVYDFMPSRLYVEPDALVHLQWTGSNSHNNGNPAGDGQSGDDGVGMTGTDRHNFVQIDRMDENYPIPLSGGSGFDHIFNYVDCYNRDGSAIGDWVDCALILATSGYYRTKAETVDKEFDSIMDDSPASLIGGVVLEFKNIPATGKEFLYMSSRNNNFGSRSQKGVLILTGTDFPLPDYANLPKGS